MKQIFYDHLVVREDIEVTLDRYHLNSDDREEIIRLADETLHHEVLNVILTHLSKDKHHKFLIHLHKSPHDPKLLAELKSDIADIEEKIQAVAKKVKTEIINEIVRSVSASSHHPKKQVD